MVYSKLSKANDPVLKILWSVSKQKNIKIFLCANFIRCVTVFCCIKMRNVYLCHSKAVLSWELAKASGAETISVDNGTWFKSHVILNNRIYLCFSNSVNFTYMWLSTLPTNQTEKLPYSFNWFILWDYTVLNIS